MSIIPLRRYDGVDARLKYGLSHFIAAEYVSDQTAVPPGAVAEVFNGDGGFSLVVDLRSWMQDEWLTSSGLSYEHLNADEIRDCFHYSRAICEVRLDQHHTVKLRDHYPANEETLSRGKLPRIETSLGYAWILSLPEKRMGGSVQKCVSDLYQDLKLKINLVMGESKLKLKYIKTLSEGDVLLITTLRQDIVCNEQVIGKYNSEDNAFMTISLHEDEQGFDVDNDDNLHDFKKQGIENLKVNLEFIVFQKQLSLKELMMLSPGEALGIGTGGKKSISISANGSVVGKGELIWLEGQMGVEIQELYAGVSDGE